MPWKKVTKVAVAVGHAEGFTALNALDNALLAAGIGNVNLVKVTSIIPPDVDLLAEIPKIRPGAIIPTAYASQTGRVEGEIISAAVGYGLPEDPARPGVIMEYSDKAPREVAERMIRRMIEAAFRTRGEPLGEVRVFGVEHRVERIGCAVAAVALLSEDDLL
ncbi:MAG: arginine decarboxylase, pyruvoyl-dependent [Candidatus Rokubacteria bacterium]|nr:arginine decarboxylase, pyruvoyl-dependent [Candidatus Rokubacteria bacterium]